MNRQLDTGGTNMGTKLFVLLGFIHLTKIILIMHPISVHSEYRELISMKFFFYKKKSQFKYSIKYELPNHFKK